MSTRFTILLALIGLFVTGLAHAVTPADTEHFNYSGKYPILGDANKEGKYASKQQPVTFTFSGAEYSKEALKASSWDKVYDPQDESSNFLRLDSDATMFDYPAEDFNDKDGTYSTLPDDVIKKQKPLKVDCRRVAQKLVHAIIDFEIVPETRSGHRGAKLGYMVKPRNTKSTGQLDAAIASEQFSKITIQKAEHGTTPYECKGDCKDLTIYYALRGGSDEPGGPVKDLKSKPHIAYSTWACVDLGLDKVEGGMDACRNIQRAKA